MESVDEKFMKFSKSGCHPGWSGLHILVESGFESMINHESNQHQPMWITILSNRDPYVMVCCHNPHITGLFFIPKESRNPLGPTVWGPFSSLLLPGSKVSKSARTSSSSKCFSMSDNVNVPVWLSSILLNNFASNPRNFSSKITTTRGFFDLNFVRSGCKKNRAMGEGMRVQNTHIFLENITFFPCLAKQAGHPQERLNGKVCDPLV